MGWGAAHRRRGLVVALAVMIVIGAPASTDAGCNVIPLASRTFGGVKGALNRPYAAPKESLEVELRPCDGTSLGATAGDHVITIAFKPTGSTKRHLAILTTQPCATMPSCGANAKCYQLAAPDLVILPAGATTPQRLRFPFPTTQTSGTPASSYSGSAAVAVTLKSDPLPCGLETGTCASQPNVLACIDSFVDSDCTTPTTYALRHFTALPQPNNFAGECFKEKPPCQDSRKDLRVALDDAGNALIPMNWQGVMVGSAGSTLRLLRGALKWNAKVSIPARVFVASYSWDGLRLPPIFDPLVDPNGLDNVIRLFGTTDAPYSVLRIARHAGECNGGPNVGLPCSTNQDCPGASCPDACVGGGNEGAACTGDAACPGGRCGRLFDVVPPANGAPVTMEFGKTPRGCRNPPHSDCTAACTGSGNVCARYALRALLPVRFPALQTEVLSAYVVPEDLASDQNGDADAVDEVIAMQDRLTGEPQHIGVGGKALGRAVVMGQRGAFRYPHAAVEGSLLAFLESEAGQNQPGNGAIMRVFTLGPVDLTNGATLRTDPTEAINSHSVVISSGRVFFRAASSDRLMVWDTAGSSNPRRLCSTTNVTAPGRMPVAVSAGSAAFLRPEVSAGTNACPGSSLNGDGDITDDVVQLWTGGAPRNLSRAATAVSLSPSWVSALVSEKGELNAVDPEVTCSVAGDRNCDGDVDDDVLAVHPVKGSGWINVAQAAVVAEGTGDAVVFLTQEWKQSAILNGDGDYRDQVLQLYYPPKPSGSGRLVNVAQAAEEFVIGDPVVCDGQEHQFVAFRTNELSQGEILNGDQDLDDDVLQIVDLRQPSPVAFGPGQAVTPCTLDACDPRLPYRVVGRTVRFLTSEAKQGKDLNHDGDTNDIVVQAYDACTAFRPASYEVAVPQPPTAIGAVALGTEGLKPLGALAFGAAASEANQLIDPLLEQDGTQMFFANRPGRCVPRGTRAQLDDCGGETIPDLARGTCVLADPPSCDARNPCPPSADCDETAVAVSLSTADVYADGEPDYQIKGTEPIPALPSDEPDRLLQSSAN